MRSKWILPSLIWLWDGNIQTLTQKSAENIGAHVSSRAQGHRVYYSTLMHWEDSWRLFHKCFGCTKEMTGHHTFVSRSRAGCQAGSWLVTSAVTLPFIVFRSNFSLASAVKLTYLKLLSGGIVSNKLPRRHVCGVLAWSLIDSGGPSPLRVVRVLGCIRKLAEQKGREQASKQHPVLFLSQGPALSPSFGFFSWWT